MKTKTPPLQIRAEFKLETWNPEKRTIDVVWTTGHKDLRRTWYGDPYYEELVVTPEAVRLDRLNAGGPVLDSHWGYSLRSQFGVVQRAWIENGLGMATLQLSEREDYAPIVADIVAGIIRNISVGYRVHVYEKIEAADGSAPTYRATDWEPYEISFVTMPFDPGAQTRAAGAPQPTPFEVEIRDLTATPDPAAPGGPMEENDPMTTRNQTAGGTEPNETPANQTQITDQERRAIAEQERARVLQIRNLVRIAQVGDELAETLIRDGVDLAEAQRRITEDWEKRGGAQQVSGARGVQQVVDEAEKRREAMAGALLIRMHPGAKLEKDVVEMSRDFRYMPMSRMAEECLAAAGVNVRMLSRVELASRALHSTSDFPLILQNVANKRLRSEYEETPATYHMWARRAPNAPDFKDITAYQVGAAPDLELVGEAGEFKYGTVGEGAEKYRVFTYGKIIGFTRQMLVNDDMRAFDRLLTGFASSGRRLENRLVYKQLAGNPVMADTKTLFHADHGNLAAAGGAIAVATLGAGRAAMRKQKGLSKETLNITPRYLIVPSDLEQVAYQYTSSQFVPTKAADTNEFRAGGRTALEPIVESILDEYSVTAWYLVGDGRTCDTVEYCWLDGAEGVRMESEIGFEVDGIKLKAALDFGSKAVDHRGVYRNDG